MKTSTAVFIIAVISLCYIEVDATSFNFSGGFYPGIIFGRTYGHQLKHNKYGHDSNWPQRDHGHIYNVSAFLPNPIINGTGSDDNERPPTRNYGSHHRNHRH